MTQCRDWLSTLWSASYRGFSFYFESDDEAGGRGLVVHQFPMRDHPYIEDVGEAPRWFEGVAYVHGDQADRLAADFTDALAARGPATLVVPIRGPVLVHAESFRRQHHRDRLGYVAFQVKFVREGASRPTVPVSFMSGAAYRAADILADRIAADAASSLLIEGQPDHVIAAATDGIALALSALDHVRETYPLSPQASAGLRDRIAAALDNAAAPLGPDTILALSAETVAITRAAADAMPPDAAQRAMSDIVAGFAATVRAVPYLSASARLAALNADAASRLARLSAATAYAEAAIRRSYRARPDGVTARADVAAMFERELSDTTGAPSHDLFVALSELQGRVAEFLTHLIADLAPVVTVRAPKIMPSLYWSWRLYADPQRAGEIVARNMLPHPSFVPATFSALAS